MLSFLGSSRLSGVKNKGSPISSGVLKKIRIRLQKEYREKSKEYKLLKNRKNAHCYENMERSKFMALNLKI